MSIFKKNIYKYREQLNVAYIKAICAKEGINVQEHLPDVWGVDLTLSIPDENDEFFTILIQLKSSSKIIFKKDTFSYLIEKDAHNHLCKNTYSPTLLFVYDVPKNYQEWIEYKNDELLIRHSIYYYSYSNEMVLENSDSKFLRILKTNLVDPKNFKSKMNEIYNEWYNRPRVQGGVTIE